MAGVKSLVGTHATNGDGDASFPLTPARRTLYTAVYAGDANHQASAAEGRTVTVQPHLTATISHGYTTLGGYHYYHYNGACPGRAAFCPLFVVTAFPNMAGQTVWAVVQERVGSTWKTAVSFHATLGTMSHATIKIRYANRAVIGHQFRVVAQYRGNTDWAAVAWGYWYFRVTA